MKFRILLIFILLFSFLFALDECYHTNEEIYDEIMALQNEYPEIMKVYQIGTSLGAEPYQEPLPIWAVKISDNVETDEDEPAVMYTGQCHAEEVLGVEITMHMINDILDNRDNPPYSYWISELEIWLNPTYNPEGLEIVTDEIETSWRKNQRDNNFNGILDIVSGPGGDIDGVDLNRNYGADWVHGDTLYCEGGEEDYDYYRGPAPFSEGGTQAIRDLAAQQHFIYSVNWHSSRTGNFSEKVFYSHEWSLEKRSEDFDLIQNIAETVAGKIPKEDGSANYEPSPSGGRKGNAHNWFYKKHGTIQLLIECGTHNLQPDEEICNDTSERCSNGVYYLMNRVLGFETSAAMLTGHVTDATSGEPIVAEVIVEEKKAPYFEPRLTDELYGRFWRPLLPGTYTLTVKKEGYETKTIPNIVVNNSLWKIEDVTLSPLQEISISANITDINGNSIENGFVKNLSDNEIYSFTDGNFALDTFVGSKEFLFYSDNYSPFYFSGNFSSNENLDIELENLSDSNLQFNEDWNDSSNDWEFNGSWSVEDDIFSNSEVVTNNSEFNIRFGDFYANDSSNDITLLEALNISDEGKTLLTFKHKYYTEANYDLCKVQVSDDLSTWETVKVFSGINKKWKADIMQPEMEIEMVDLSNFSGETYLRFAFESDDSKRDPGWWIDDIKITNSNFVPNDEENFVPSFSKLIGNFPNPMRLSNNRDSGTKISFRLAKNLKKAELKIFNIRGQIIKSFDLDHSNKELNHIVWNGKNNDNKLVSSGVYFYQLKTDKYCNSKKLLLVK